MIPRWPARRARVRPRPRRRAARSDVFLRLSTRAQLDGRGPDARPRLGRRVPPAPGPFRRGALPAHDPLRSAHELPGRRRSDLAAALRPRARRARRGVLHGPAAPGDGRRARRRAGCRSSSPPRAIAPRRAARRQRLSGRRRRRGRALRRDLPGAHPLDAVRPHRPARRRVVLRACSSSRPSSRAASDRIARRGSELLAGLALALAVLCLAGGDLLGRDLRARARSRGGLARRGRLPAALLVLARPGPRRRRRDRRSGSGRSGRR